MKSTRFDRVDVSHVATLKTLYTDHVRCRRPEASSCLVFGARARAGLDAKNKNVKYFPQDSPVWYKTIPSSAWRPWVQALVRYA